MTSDEVLMLEYQSGSRPALEELFARYRDPLFGFFRRRLEGKDRAEDLTQEIFLAVMRATSRYEPRALVRTYLYGIAMNLLYAERRKQFRDASIDSFSEPSTGENPDAALWVKQALGKLDTPEREIVMLREYEQLSYAEIAELLELPVNTVRSKLFRARLALKNHLTPENESESAHANPVVASRIGMSPMANPSPNEARK